MQYLFLNEIYYTFCLIVNITCTWFPIHKKKCNIRNRIFIILEKIFNLGFFLYLTIQIWFNIFKTINADFFLDIIIFSLMFMFSLIKRFNLFRIKWNFDPYPNKEILIIYDFCYQLLNFSHVTVFASNFPGSSVLTFETGKFYI